MPQPHHRGEYPPDWKAIAAAVKADAGGRCVRCGHGHDPAAGRTLTVHHFDGDKGNCRRWNLMALCQACHLSVQARVDHAITLMFDPSPWVIPYLVGFYEAGRGIPPLSYDREAWVLRYGMEVGEWPAWARCPRPNQARRSGPLLAGLDSSHARATHAPRNGAPL